MAKAASDTRPMSKSEIAKELAEKVGISKKQAVLFLQAQAELAYKEAKNTFLIPGIGKLKLRNTKPRDMVMPFGEQKGQIKHIEARMKVKFSVAKAAKDAILGAKR